MGEKRSFTLLEVVIAFVILSLVVSGVAATLVSIKRLSKRELGYCYTALNLVKEVLEFTEAVNITQRVFMNYKWYDSPSPGRYVGGGPFSFLGNINDDRKLVPKGAPHSVKMAYETQWVCLTEDAEGTWSVTSECPPGQRRVLDQRATIRWKDHDDDPEYKVGFLSVIPIRWVNAARMLRIGVFPWTAPWTTGTSP